MTPTTYPPEPPSPQRSIFHALAVALVLASAIPPPTKDKPRERLPAGLAEFLDQTQL